MAQYRLGAHTFVFAQYGFDLPDEVGRIFRIVKDAGFENIEIHPPFIAEEGWFEKLQAAVDETGLRIVGVSYGQPVWDIRAYDRIMQEADDFTARVAYLGKMNCGMSCSGKRLADRTDEENVQAIKVWRELGELFQSRGLALNYHTHGEPMDDIRLVIENVPAELVALGPDLDWLRVGGVDPHPFVREHLDRITMLHLRDYHLGGDRTEALGEGDADYAELAAILEAGNFTGDAVVELAIPAGAQPTRPVEELLRISRHHLTRTMEE